MAEAWLQLSRMSCLLPTHRHSYIRLFPKATAPSGSGLELGLSPVLSLVLPKCTKTLSFPLVLMTLRVRLFTPAGP